MTKTIAFENTADAIAFLTPFVETVLGQKVTVSIIKTAAPVVTKGRTRKAKRMGRPKGSKNKTTTQTTTQA